MSPQAVEVADEAVSAEAGEAVAREMQRKAALVVCSQSRDAAEARELLEMLGLPPKPNAEESAAHPSAPAGAAPDAGRAESRARVDDAAGKPNEAGKGDEAKAAGGEADNVHGHGIGLALHIDREEAFCDACTELFNMLRESGVLGTVDK